MTHQPLSGLHILVVEDEMMLLLMIEGMLNDMGCDSIRSAATVKQALALVESESLDLAMLDLNLNGDRSYPVADALALRGVPFMFSTGYSIEGVADGYRDRPVLRKPYQFEELTATLERLVSTDRLQPEAA